MPADMLGSVTPWLKTLQHLPVAFRKKKSKLLNADFKTPFIASSLFLAIHSFYRPVSQLPCKFCLFSKPWLTLLPLAGTFPAAMVPSSCMLLPTEPLLVG